MELSNEFTVDVGMDEAWRVLTDLQRIAPCMPGAVLEDLDGDEYKGAVKVKVGPVTAQYRGVARFVERNEEARRAVVRAEGREARGQGSASAVITATLEPAGDATHVSVVTELNISGRAAQFGRGVLADVTNKLLAQFVESLETTVLGGPSGPERVDRSEIGRNPDGTGDAPGVCSPGAVDASTATDHSLVRSAAPVSVVGLVGPSLLERVLPVAALAVLLALVSRMLRRRRPAR